MKKFYKILLFAASLAGFGFSVGILWLFYRAPSVVDALKSLQALYPWLNGIFTGYIVFVCLCFLLLMLAALFLPGKSGDLTLEKSRGRLLFSRQAVESAVRYSFADVDGINFCKVQAKLGRQPEKTRIYVKLSVNDTTKLVSLTQTVQDRIDSSLKSSLGIAAQSIDIKVAESAPDNAARKETAANMVKSGRVE